MIKQWMEIIENYTGFSENVQKEVVSVLAVFVFLYLFRFVILRIVFHYKTDIRSREYLD